MGQTVGADAALPWPRPRLEQDERWRRDLLGLVPLIPLRHQVLDLPLCGGRCALGPPLESLPSADSDLRSPPDNRPPSSPHLIVGAGLALVHRATDPYGRTGNALPACKPRDEGPGDDRKLRCRPVAEWAERKGHREATGRFPIHRNRSGCPRAASPVLARKRQGSGLWPNPLIYWRARQDLNPRPPGS